MRSAVIGAGLAGLAAARTLKSAGWEVVVFEKASSVGGRVSTVKLEDFTFDSGATSFAPHGKALEEVILEAGATLGLVQVESPIYVHESLRPHAGTPERNASNRYTFVEGNGALAAWMAQDLDVRPRSEIKAVERSKTGYEVASEAFDAAVLALPAPEVAELMERSGEHRPISAIYYRPCISVLLGYRNPTPDVKYHALLDPEQRHPMTWLSVESAKSPGRAPEGCTALVAQMSPQFSRSHFDFEDGKIIEHTADYIERLYGPDWAIPEVSGVVRYPHSQPEAVASFQAVNRAGATLLVAGDFLFGSRTEHAYESGLAAARLLINRQQAERT